jgi:formylglycine-generating enzyme required for sulfatase activity
MFSIQYSLAKTALMSVLAGGLCVAAWAGEKQATIDVSAVKSLKAPSFVVPKTGDMRMILIKPGKFTMGSAQKEVGRGDDEVQHEVTISRPFYMAETEATHAQYMPVMWPDFMPILVTRGRYGHSVPEIHQGGSFLTIERERRDLSRFAMDGMTWDDAVEFGKKMTARERDAGRLPKGYVYRLPTEAEWEYACRAGTTGQYNVQADKKLLFAVCNGYKGCNGSRLFLRPVPHGDTPEAVAGSRTPNAWGLYDMHGNLYEWCLDWYGPYPSTTSTTSTSSGQASSTSSGQVPKGESTDPVGPKTGERRVARGGCFLSGQAAQYLPDVPGVADRYLRSAARNCFRYDHQMRISGMRLVLAPEITK